MRRPALVRMSFEDLVFTAFSLSPSEYITPLALPGSVRASESVASRWRMPVSSVVSWGTGGKASAGSVRPGFRRQARMA